MRTLRISLIATAIATAASFWAREFGLTQRIWPGHPQMAGFLLTLVACIVVQIAWPMTELKGQGDKG
ncbi:MAG TPA: hypothetical protein VF845_05275 [Terriglobales bacterium]